MASPPRRGARDSTGEDVDDSAAITLRANPNATGSSSSSFLVSVQGIPKGRRANALKIKAHLGLEEDPILAEEGSALMTEDDSAVTTTQ